MLPNQEQRDTHTEANLAGRDADVDEYRGGCRNAKENTIAVTR
jgi:hypothetical protein